MRRLILIIGILFLSACQTMPPKSGFNAAQTKVLLEEGFVQVGENYQQSLASKVLFGFDKSELSSEVAANLNQMTKNLLAVNIKGATIEGHTDNQGDSEYNKQLSLRRAETVKAEFIAAGMAPNAVQAVGFGESDPIEDNSTAAGRAENRRVVIIISPKDAMPY